MTIETTDHLLTEQEARRLTERIRTALDRVSTAWADLAERIGEAYERRADLALGYSSWAEYAEAELKPPSALAAEVRRELVGLLSARGMSPKAVAPAVGVTRRRVSQIRAEVEQGGNDFHPDPTEHIDLTTGEILTDQRAGTIPPSSSAIDVEGQDTGAGAPPAPRPAQDLDDWRRDTLADAEATGKIVKLTGPNSVTSPGPAKVVGLDGKQYSRPEPPQQRRKALPEQFMTASLALADKVAAIVRLSEDDRFTQNAEKVATANRSDLLRAIDALAGVVAKLPERN